MPATCCVLNCGSRAGRDTVKFYRIPSELNFPYKPQINELSKRRRERWLEAIQRKDFTGVKLKYSKVCSRHFCTGKPAALDDESHLDWVPSLYMGFENYVKVNKQLQIGVAKTEKAEEDSPKFTPADECKELERQESEKQASSNQGNNISSETKVCKHCSETVIVPVIKCVRCNENLHPICLMQAAQLKNATCKHVAEEQGDFTTVNHETAYLVNIIRELQEKTILLEQDCKFWRGRVDFLEKQLTKE